ncbi:hypothetical protein ASZ78_013000 [Callipepla squamata]|uniref:Uncharacterized protein n=1 Tax=Callipepla squamata TaxID=9009 RepID=A0A226NFA5_CALSU|nr:hypothetical protein ASZ78_013000 [Callipepla squamata]
MPPKQAKLGMRLSSSVTGEQGNMLPVCSSTKVTKRQGRNILGASSLMAGAAGRRLCLAAALLLLAGARALAPSHHLTARDLARLRAALERPFGDLRAAYHSVVGLHSLGLSVADQKVTFGQYTSSQHEAVKEVKVVKIADKHNTGA